MSSTNLVDIQFLYFFFLDGHMETDSFQTVKDIEKYAENTGAITSY